MLSRDVTLKPNPSGPFFRSICIFLPILRVFVKALIGRSLIWDVNEVVGCLTGTAGGVFLVGDDTWIGGPGLIG